MKRGTLAVLAAIAIVLAIGWTIAHADPGDDAVLCCNSINPSLSNGSPGFTPQMLGCVAINGDEESINRCAAAGNWLLGCGETGFVCAPPAPCTGVGAVACSPALASSIKKDCACGGFLAQPIN